MNDLISVIVPVYNVEKYICKCIDSIINQTYRNIEIILVDDGSTDESGKICDEYEKKDKRIIVIHKPNCGVSDARNTGIDIAKGEFISFIDSDDYVEENYIETMHDAIKVENDIDMVIGAHKVLYSNGKIINEYTNERKICTPKEVLERILYHDGIDLSAWAKLYRSKLFRDVRFISNRLYEDAGCTYKLIDKSNKIMLISEPIYNYIIRNNSISNNKFTNRKMDLIISTQEMCEYIKSKYIDLEKAANRRMMYAYLSTLSQLSMSNEKFEKEEKILLEYIKQNGKMILLDKRAPLRDKIGIISTKLGFNTYKIIWRIYVKITKRYNKKFIKRSSYNELLYNRRATKYKYKI